MNESRYLEEVRRLPRPSDEQVDAFVEYVAAAHSWYKHLSLLPPGTPFLFFLNPNAGREWVVTKAGAGFRDRTSDTPPEQRFHYTWQPTAEYVERFGYLDYFAAAGTSFLVPVGPGVLDTSTAPRIQARDGRWVALPAAIRDVGAVRLTAVIHPLGQKPSLWPLRLGMLGSPPFGRDVLPDRPTGDDALDVILEIVRRLPAGGDAMRRSPEFAELETRRLPAYSFAQKQRMGATIRRAVELVYGPS